MKKVDTSMYLTDAQYLDLMKRIRADLGKVKKIIAIDCNEIGCKHTLTNVGLCAGEETEGGWSKDKYTTRATAMWVKEFDRIGKSRYEHPQMFTMKYRQDRHRCPLDKRRTADGLGYGCSCFYHCRAFKDKKLTIAEVKKLYDEQIALVEKGDKANEKR
jgi:hypothetical protein